MTEQLKLIEIETSMAPVGPSRPKAKLKNRESKSQVWWKLSNEERQQGLAGVRAIRAILQTQSQIGGDQMAKAS